MNKKKKCDDCPRIVRMCKLHKNKITGKLLCRFCNNKIGQNKFYTPSNKFQRISSFSITEIEKQVLMKGKSREQISKLCASLKRVGKINRFKKADERKEKAIEGFNKTEMKRRFTEGLK